MNTNKIVLLYTVFLNIFVSVVIAIIITPKYSVLFFVGNLAFLWLPQAITVGVVYLSTRKASVSSGLASVLSLYLVIYFSWMVFCSQPAMAWVGYLFSLPGAGASAIIFSIYTKNKLWSYLKVTVASTVCATLGIVINLILVWYWLSDTWEISCS